MSLSWLAPADRKLFFTKNDPSDPRLGDKVQSLSQIKELRPGCKVILGYPDDEGVKQNSGRPGAAGGPDSIRQVLYKMTPSLGASGKTKAFFDAGNLKIESDVPGRHDRATEIVKNILAQKASVVSLGGGHDYAFSDLDAFCKLTLEDSKIPFIINFDAHLDVRPDTKDQNSGTAFFRLLNKYGSDIQFHEVGIQDWCNASSHFKWVLSKKAQVLTLTEILNSRQSFCDLMKTKIMSKIKSRHRLALSVDIDGFESFAAPGASQVFPVGLNPGEFLKFWDWTIGKFSPQWMGIYEVNPTFDSDQRTARLAAVLIHRFLFGF